MRIENTNPDDKNRYVTLTMSKCVSTGEYFVVVHLGTDNKNSAARKLHKIAKEISTYKTKAFKPK